MSKRSIINQGLEVRDTQEYAQQEEKNIRGGREENERSSEVPCVCGCVVCVATSGEDTASSFVRPHGSRGDYPTSWLLSSHDRDYSPTLPMTATRRTELQASNSPPRCHELEKGDGIGTQSSSLL